MPFKVCRKRRDGRLTSLYRFGSEMVEYRPRRWTRPQKGCGPLLAYADLDGPVWEIYWLSRDEHFTRPDIVVYEVEIEACTDQTQARWDLDGNREKPTHLWGRVILCDSIKLLRKACLDHCAQMRKAAGLNGHDFRL